MSLPLIEDPDEPAALLYDHLMELHRQLFATERYEAAYHVLAAALHVAQEVEDIERLGNIEPAGPEPAGRRGRRTAGAPDGIRLRPPAGKPGHVSNPGPDGQIRRRAGPSRPGPARAPSSGLLVMPGPGR